MLVLEGLWSACCRQVEALRNVYTLASFDFAAARLRVTATGPVLATSLADTVRGDDYRPLPIDFCCSLAKGRATGGQAAASASAVKRESRRSVPRN